MGRSRSRTARNIGLTIGQWRPRIRLAVHNKRPASFSPPPTAPSPGQFRRVGEVILDLRFLPASSDGFLLGAEPAFTLVLVDLRLVVVVLSRHVVGAFAFGVNVALD